MILLVTLSEKEKCYNKFDSKNKKKEKKKPKPKTKQVEGGRKQKNEQLKKRGLESNQIRTS